jgi:homoserine O-acetyltransferase
MRFRALLFAVAIGLAAPALAQEGGGKVNPADWPGYQAGDYVIKDYKFVGGETLPEVRLHYRTIGMARKNAKGEIINGVLLLQGNTGTGDNWFRPTLANELFRPGQPLDPAKYYVIMPDALGRGGSSKPSDGLKANFLPLSRHDRRHASAGDGWAEGRASAAGDR